MADEIEVDLKIEPAIVRDRRGREAAAGQVQRHLPPMVYHRRLGEADLADNLCPKMQGSAGILPRLEGQRRPVSGLAGPALARARRTHGLSRIKSDPSAPLYLTCRLNSRHKTRARTRS